MIFNPIELQVLISLFFKNKVIELKTKASDGRNCGNYTFDSLMVIMLFVKAAAERSVFSHVIS